MSTATHSKTTRPIAQPAAEGKSIIFDRATKDYACYLDGDYIGHRANYSDAENTLNGLMMERLYDERRCAPQQDVDGHGDDELFGALPDGSPIRGLRDRLDPTGRAGIVRASIGDTWRLTAQDKPNMICLYGPVTFKQEVTLDDINALRALLLTDIPEQLLAAAAAYGRGDAAPPAPAAPVVPDGAFGVLSDGSPIVGEYAGKERWGVVGAELPSGDVTMDDKGYFFIADSTGHEFANEWHMSELPAMRAAMRDILLSDALEQLHAAAIAWNRGDTTLYFDEVLGTTIGATPAPALDPATRPREIVLAALIEGAEESIAPEVWQTLANHDPIIAAARADATRHGARAAIQGYKKAKGI